MDESIYGDTRRLVNPAPCIFEKALLSGNAVCELACRHALAERETIGCTRLAAHANCATLATLIRERCTFPLRLPPPAVALPHAMSMQLQCGGLRGVQSALGAGHSDVHRLLSEAQSRWDSLMELPWMEIVGVVAAWTGRRRHHSGTKP